jgi:hypothetical protein
MGLDGRKVWTAGFAIALLVAVAPAQQAGWTVQPQWVRAHEEFLASDAMRGRGSATHDEEVAATYVASEFIGYGLKMAPGMTGYIQAAEIVSPELDGHASLTAGATTLEEGTDFDLVVSPGTSVSGPLVRMTADGVAQAHFARGSVVMLSGVSDVNALFSLQQQLRRAGAVAILVRDDGQLAKMFEMLGSKTETPIRLKDAPSSRGGLTIAVLHAAAWAKLASAPDGQTLSAEVKVVPQTTPRETYNAIGYLPGTDTNAGTILLTAHLDHLGVGRPVNGDAIYNGANDDAAGTTAVLELAHALAAGPRLKRSVLFVCYGSEEVGELGSTYFGEHPPVPLKSLIANLEFEMIGNQDPKMPKGVLLLTGWERSNLGPMLKAHGALLGPDPYPEEHFFERSDNYALALQGVVAHTAAGWGTVPTYHQPDDDLGHLDLPFMTAAIQSLVEPIRWLANSDFKPEWMPGGRPSR